MSDSQDSTPTIVGGQTGYAVPLIVAVTGHRDLVPDEEPRIRAHVHEFLNRLLTDYPERGVTVMSSLAEGADQLVAEVALELERDFLGLCDRAVEVTEKSRREVSRGVRLIEGMARVLAPIL